MTVPDALYDLDADIGETTDLSKKHPGQLNRLIELIERHKATVEPLDLTAKLTGSPDVDKSATS